MTETTPPPPKRNECEFDFDTIVVGGGPSGLTLATYLPGRTLLLERDATLGGIHKVRRDVDGYFGEHGPRVYSGCFVNLRRVLQDIGLPWDEVFTPATFSPALIDGKDWSRWMSVREVAVLTAHFLRMVVNPDHGKDLTMRQVCRAHRFSDRSTAYINSVCLFSDGANIDRYSLHEFLRGFNDHVATSFYEPRQGNDKLLFPRWQKALEARGVVIKVATPVREITHICGRAVGVVAGNVPQAYTARRVILAVPPAAVEAVLRGSRLEEPGLRCLTDATEYDPYFPVAYHFPTAMAPLVTHEGLRSTPWGLIYMEMTRYVRGEPLAFVSVAASRLDVPSPHTGKTAHESTRKEVVAEMLRQLPLSDAVKATLVKAVPSSCLGRKNDKWANTDEAFVYNAAYPRGLPFRLACCTDLYTVGCHNLKSWYAFTSAEGAVCNALAFMGMPHDVPVTPIRVLRVLLLVALAALLAMAVKR